MPDRPHPGERGGALADTPLSDADRSALEFDIKMALSKRPFRVGQGRDEMAAQIVEDLVGAGWEFSRRPKAPGHSTP